MPTTFVSSWSSCLSWQLGSCGGLLKFSWVSLMCTEIILVIKLLFVLLLFPVIVFLQWSLSQEPRREERNYFFFPTIPTIVRWEEKSKAKYGISVGDFVSTSRLWSTKCTTYSDSPWGKGVGLLHHASYSLTEVKDVMLRLVWIRWGRTSRED